MTSDAFVIDSSVFVAFYYAGDSQHVNAKRVMAELQEKTLIVHPYIIQETATVLTYKFGFEVAQHFLADITMSGNVIIPPVNMAMDIEGFLQLKKKISFADSAILQLATSMNAHLVTFDEQILSLYTSVKP